MCRESSIYVPSYWNLGENVEVDVQLRRKTCELYVLIQKYVDIENSGGELFPSKEAIILSYSTFGNFASRMSNFNFFLKKIHSSVRMTL